MEEMLKVLEQMGIRDERVLAVIAKVDRKDFVPKDYQSWAYADTAIPIGYQQTISQPYTVAKMIELLVHDSLFMESQAKVLEIGTGSGWQACILAHLFSQVYSVELIPELAREAEIRIQRSKIRNIKLKAGNGKEGWPEYAPFDGIICGADAEGIPQAWKKQLAQGGRIVCPVRGTMTRVIKRLRDKEIKYEEEKFGRYVFVPLV
jgi:protein-L-isoaspartate(D-aspartate) O-methyltransferase